jgi:translation initiation factor IF-2
MVKIRINELARELEVKPNVILDMLPELGVTEKKTHSSSIDEPVAIEIKRRLTGESNGSPDSGSRASGSTETETAPEHAAESSPAAEPSRPSSPPRHEPVAEAPPAPTREAPAEAVPPPAPRSAPLRPPLAAGQPFVPPVAPRGIPIPARLRRPPGPVRFFPVLASLCPALPRKPEFITTRRPRLRGPRPLSTPARERFPACRRRRVPLPGPPHLRPPRSCREHPWAEAALCGPPRNRTLPDSRPRGRLFHRVRIWLRSSPGRPRRPLPEFPGPECRRARRARFLDSRFIVVLFVPASQ